MGTITLNINDCGSSSIYTACADFGIDFESVGVESEFLNVGELISESGIIGDYFIEWRLNSIDGTSIFNSGNPENIDIELDGYHPLVNEIIIGGNLYPVLKYIYIDGFKYTVNEEEGARYSPDLLTCLAPPPILVNVIGCGTTNYTGDYDYRLIREVNEGEKSRSLKYQISETTQYLAWGFDTINIPDQIELFYCTSDNIEGELIDSMILGKGVIEDYTPSNYPRQVGYNPLLPVTPIISAGNTGSTTGIVPYISDLTSFVYQEGDFIRIQITGNVYNPAQDNTKWTLYLKCYDSLPVMYNFNNLGVLTEDSISFDWNPTNCRYELTYNTDETLFSSNIASLFYNTYLWMTNYHVNNPLNTSNGGSTYLRNYTTISYQTTCGGGCNLADGQIIITKLNGGVQIEFSSVNDYNIAVTNISTVLAHSKYTDYLNATPQDTAYYGSFIINGFASGISCDNVGSTVGLFIHLSSNIVYDAINNIILFEFPTIPITNELEEPIDSCDSSYNSIQTYIINEFNKTIDMVNNTTYTASIRKNCIVSGTFPGITPIIDSMMMPFSCLRIPVIMVNNIVNLTNYTFVEESPLNYPEYRAYQIKDIVTIQNMTTHELRLSSWKLERDKWLRTRVVEDFGTYEIIDEGV